MKKRFVKFIFVGMVNTLFGYSLYALFLFLSLHYAAAVLLGTAIGVLFNFKTTGSLVFQVNNNKLIFRFIGVYIVTYVLNVAVLALFDHFHFNMYLAGSLIVLPIAALSFFLMSKFVFREAAGREQEASSPLPERERHVTAVLYDIHSKDGKAVD